MGLFVFLLIMLAAAWGMVLQLGDAPSTPATPVAQQDPVQHKRALPAVAPAGTTESRDGSSIDANTLDQSDSASTGDSGSAPAKE